jgi:hypothetical protein
MSEALIPRLVFGCARLTGGATQRQALRLLDLVFDVGVRAVDVAPPYGIGTAEAVVGEALRRHPAGGAIEIIAKVGLPRPRFAQLKAGLRAAKRLLMPARPRSAEGWQPLEPAVRFGEGDFEPAAMQASVELSRRRLGRFDRLLLHACGPAELTPEVMAAMEALAAENGAQPGYALGSRFDPGLDARYPSHYFAETAIDPASLTAPANPRERPDLLFHSLAVTANGLAATDPDFARALDAAAALLADTDASTARIAAAYALAAQWEPTARFVFASTDSGRLARLLAAFTAIDRNRLAPPMTQAFAASRG